MGIWKEANLGLKKKEGKTLWYDVKKPGKVDREKKYFSLREKFSKSTYHVSSLHSFFHFFPFKARPRPIVKNVRRSIVYLFFYKLKIFYYSSLEV